MLFSLITEAIYNKSVFEATSDGPRFTLNGKNITYIQFTKQSEDVRPLCIQPQEGLKQFISNLIADAQHLEDKIRLQDSFSSAPLIDVKKILEKGIKSRDFRCPPKKTSYIRLIALVGLISLLFLIAIKIKNSSSSHNSLSNRRVNRRA